MTTIIYVENIEELIDLKIDQKVFGEHKGAKIKYIRKKLGRPRKRDL